jgi:uncharacterized protein YukE
MALFQKLGGVAVGGDVGQLRKFSTDLKTILGELEQTLNKVDSAINATTWAGKDAEAFASDWDSRKKSATTMLQDILNTLSEQSLKQAEAQDAVSAA